MQRRGLVQVSPCHQDNSVIGSLRLTRWNYRNSVGSGDEEHSAKIKTSGGARSPIELVDCSGAPAGSRTQGPRLKSSNEGFLASARYCNGFPIIRCNIERLVRSIASMHSDGLPSIPAEFCHKIHHSGSTHKVEGVGSWLWGLTARFNITDEFWMNLQKTYELRLADKATKHNLEAYPAVQGSTCPPVQ